MALHNNPFRFVGITVAIIIAISLIWPIVAPKYNWLIIRIADPFTPHRITLESKDDSILISYEQHYLGLKRNLSTWIQGSAFHFGLILVTALAAATPGFKLSRRFKLMLLNWFILFAIQVTTVLIISKVLASQEPGAMSLLNNPIQILFITIGCDLFPVLTWGLAVKYWRKA